MRLRLTNGGKLGTDMENHDDGHAEGENMHEVGGGLEDDGVGQLDTAGIAARRDARFARDGRQWTHYGA